MAFSHLVGGLAILGMFWAKDFATFFSLMLIHSLLYVPTISVSNSIAFTHLKDAQKEFGLVRMGGTIGWRAALRSDKVKAIVAWEPGGTPLRYLPDSRPEASGLQVVSPSPMSSTSATSWPASTPPS